MKWCVIWGWSRTCAQVASEEWIADLKPRNMQQIGAKWPKIDRTRAQKITHNEIWLVRSNLIYPKPGTRFNSAVAKVSKVSSCFIDDVNLRVSTKRRFSFASSCVDASKHGTTSVRQFPNCPPPLPWTCPTKIFDHKAREAISFRGLEMVGFMNLHECNPDLFLFLKRCFLPISPPTNSGHTGLKGHRSGSPDSRRWWPAWVFEEKSSGGRQARQAKQATSSNMSNSKKKKNIWRRWWLEYLTCWICMNLHLCTLACKPITCYSEVWKKCCTIQRSVKEQQ